jgi:hypothetical protein
MTIGKVAHGFVSDLKIVYLRRVKGIQPKMRKIETQMNQAITSNAQFWQNANTRVELIDGVSKVYLHGNLIAEVDEDSMKLYDGGFQSVTTKSRLNALCNEFGVAGEGVFQKNFEWFIRLWNGTEFFTTEFRSGMRLA